jgi:hypothetical protein
MYGSRMVLYIIFYIFGNPTVGRPNFRKGEIDMMLRHSDAKATNVPSAFYNSIIVVRGNYWSSQF